MLAPPEHRQGHGVVVLRAAHHLGRTTGQMVPASAVAWPGMPGHNNSKPRDHSGTQQNRELMEGSKICDAAAFL